MVDFFISQSQINNLDQGKRLPSLKIAFSKLLQLNENDIGYFPYTPSCTERRYRVNLCAMESHSKIYQIFCDHKIRRAIMEKYCQLLTMIIEQDQAQLLISHLSNENKAYSDKNSEMMSINIEKTLHEKKIKFHAIQNLNVYSWSIALNSPQDKLALEALCGEKLLIDQRLKAKASDLAFHFCFSDIKIVYITQQPMVKITFDSQIAMNHFLAILDKLTPENSRYKTYILSSTISEKRIEVDFNIDLLNDFTILQFREAGIYHPAVQDSILISVGCFAHTFQCQSQPVYDNENHLIQINLLFNIDNPLHSTIIHGLARLNGQFRVSPDHLQPNVNQQIIQCQPILFLSKEIVTFCNSLKHLNQQMELSAQPLPSNRPILTLK